MVQPRTKVPHELEWIRQEAAEIRKKEEETRLKYKPLNDALSKYFKVEPDKPYYLESKQAQAYDFNIPDTWRLKIWQEPDTGELSYRQVTPAGWEVTETSVLSPTGEQFTWEEVNTWEDTAKFESGIFQPTEPDTPIESIPDPMLEVQQPMGMVWDYNTQRYMPATFDLQVTRNFYKRNPEFLPPGVTPTLTPDELDIVISEQEARRDELTTSFMSILPDMFEDVTEETQGDRTIEIINQIATNEEMQDVFIDALQEQGRNAETENILRLIQPEITDNELTEFFGTTRDGQIATETPQSIVRPEPLWESIRTGEVLTQSEKDKLFPTGYEIELDEWTLTRETSRNYIGVFKILGEGLTKLPRQLGASILQSFQGYKGASVVNKDWADKFIGEAQTDLNKFAQDTVSEYGNMRLPISVEDLATLPQSIAFSLTSMGGGLVAGIPVALAPVPGARVAAWGIGSTASGAVAFGMASYQIMQQYLELKNEEMKNTVGRELTLEEENTLKKDFSNKAVQYGLWEAIPEAVSNLAFGKLLTLPLSKMIGRTAAIQILTKIGGMYGEEFLTETITQKGQSAIEVEAGLRDEKITWVEAFKEIAPQTFLLTTILGGAGQITVSSVSRIKKSLKKEIGDEPIFNELNSNITEDVFAEVEAEAAMIEAPTTATEAGVTPAKGVTPEVTPGTRLFEGGYVSGITHKGKISSAKAMWFSKELQQAEYYALHGRGQVYYGEPKADAKILDLTDENIRLEFETKIRDLADQGAYGINEIVDEFEEHEGLSEGIVPSDLVEQGGIWDDAAFVNMVWEEFGFDFVKFPDGGIALNTDAMTLKAITEAPQAISEPLAPAVVPETEEVFPGIIEIKGEPIIEKTISPAEVVPPEPPIKQPPKTVVVPPAPQSPNSRNRIIRQSQEIVKQGLPGALNRLFQMIPIVKQFMRFERPALIAYAEKNPHLVVAQVAEVAARSDVAAKQVASRLPLFKMLKKIFGESALRGEKTTIEFLGTSEQAENPITGTLFDICQNPELYKLTLTQKTAIQQINEHNDTSLNYVVGQYGAEIGRFAPKPDGAFLSNVDIDENIVDYLGSESRAIAKGRGKTRYWATARDRMAADKTFKPELDVKKLIEGMDSFKASAAAGVTFREIVGGKTRLEVMQETHPKLYDRMMGLRKQLQKLQGYKRILSAQQLSAIEEFIMSPHEEADIAALDDAFFLQAGRYVAKAKAGTRLSDIESQIQAVKDELRELKPSWKAANLKPYVFVQEGLYRYFTPEQANYIINARKTTNNPILTFIERWRGQAFSGDFSPFAIQGSIGVLADPIGSLKATAGGIKAAFENKDFLHSITVDGLIDDMNSDPEGWAEFASLMGRDITGVPREYAAGYLSSIPGFDKFTETTYITVTRGTKNLYDRTWQGLVKSGVPELEAKVAAIEVASKVYPLVSPAKLGQSQARASVLRAMPTSYSFIRQPVTLINQASMGFAKFITGQKLTPQERIATRTILTMAASILAVSATSAALSAKAKGGDDEEVMQAIIDAINPDPYNGKFASLIIGDFRIPLGGPYRSIFRAIYPQDVKGIPFPVPFAGIPNFIFNRITPAIKTQINLLRNEDYYGKAIIKGEFPENIIRGALYELEGALPLSLGELMAGVRREDFLDEILQNVAAQFVGVNLMKLNNTYFHKLVRNLGLLTTETQELYFTTRDLYSKVVGVLSDVTIGEIEQRKGYPELIAIIIKTRDLKREVDQLANHSPVSLKAEDVLGEKGYYAQWGKRQELVASGDDAEWIVTELVGGKYKYKTIKGEAAVKAFDAENAQAKLGNMSKTQYALLVKYHSLPESEQKQFLMDNPDIGVVPRTKYLKEHPNENAELAIWGHAQFYTMEAYNKGLKLLKEYDIPNTAIPKNLFPPNEKVAQANFDYLDTVEEYSANSPEAMFIRANDNEFNDWYGFDTMPEKPIAYYQMKVDNRELFDKLKEIRGDELLDSVLTDEEGLTEKGRAIIELRATKVGDETFHDIERRISAISKGTASNPLPQEVVDAHVEYGKVIDLKGIKFQGAEENLFRIDNDAYNKSRLDKTIWGINAFKDDVDRTQETKWRLQVQYRPEFTTYDEEIPQKYADMADEELEVPEGYNSEWWDEQTPDEQRNILIGVDRNTMNMENEKFRDDARRIEAYELKIPEVEEWVEFNNLPISGKRRDRYIIEHGGTDPKNPTGLAKSWSGLGTGHDLPDPTTIPSVRFDEITEEYQDEFDLIGSSGDFSNIKSDQWKDDTFKDTRTGLTEREQATYDLRFDKTGKLTDFGKAEVRRNGYGMFMPEDYIERWVDYGIQEKEGRPTNWPTTRTGIHTWYEDDWYLKEHPKFYEVLKGIMRKIQPDWHMDRDAEYWSKVPTRDVFDLYVIYEKNPSGKPREDLRYDNSDLEKWLLLTGKVTKPIKEKRRRASLSPSEKWETQVRAWEELAK